MLVVAGKGHETGQIVGDRTLPFYDHAEVRAAIEARGLIDDQRRHPALDRVRRLRGDGSDPQRRPTPRASTASRSTPARSSRETSFVAIVGESNDGHDYVAQAFAKGAAAAVVAHDRADALAAYGPLLAVEDTLAGLERLGRAARARTDAKIVAITGSVGKTGSKEALRLALARSGRTHASAASYNNHWGVPLTLARMPADTEFGIFEIGMNHAGEIAPLAKMVRPHVAVITTVEAVHIENFRDVRGIADAKGEIFLGLEPGGVAVINRDNPHYDRLAQLALASPAGRVVTFGEDPRSDVRAETIVTKPDLSIVDARVFGERLAYRIGMAGRHIALNSLALVAAAQALGTDLALSALALGDLEPPAGRGARTDVPLVGGALTLVDESYNANPASVRAALETRGPDGAALARPAHRRARRHARARPGRSAPAPRTRAQRTGGGRRSRLHRGRADEGPARRAPPPSAAAAGAPPRTRSRPRWRARCGPATSSW